MRSAPPSSPPREKYTPSLHTIGVWHVVISGFTQGVGRPNGAQLLWSMLRAAHQNGRAVVELFPWNADWSHVAEWIWRFRPLERPVRVYVYAYSWGGGWGFPRLARELGKRGIEIEAAVLSDAVYRHPLRSLAWLSLCRRPRIVAPANVREVFWFFQRVNKPAGHPVVAADPHRTFVHPGRQAEVTHHYMDDLPAWYQQSIDVAAAARQAMHFENESLAAGPERTD